MQHKNMTKKAAPLLLIPLILYISCIPGHVKIKPAPQEEGYELCPVCKGTGIMEVYLSRPNQKGVELTGDEKTCADYIGCIGSSISWDRDKDESLPEFDDSGSLKERYQDSGFENPHNSVERSYVKKKVRCERCNGMGWIKKYETSGWSIDGRQTSNGFNRANELRKDGRHQ